MNSCIFTKMVTVEVKIIKCQKLPYNHTVMDSLFNIAPKTPPKRSHSLKIKRHCNDQRFKMPRGLMLFVEEARSLSQDYALECLSLGNLFREGTLRLEEVIISVSKMFHRRPDLILKSKWILPPGYKIMFATGSQPEYFKIDVYINEEVYSIDKN